MIAIPTSKSKRQALHIPLTSPVSGAEATTSSPVGLPEHVELSWDVRGGRKQVVPDLIADWSAGRPTHAASVGICWLGIKITYPYNV